MNIQQILVPVDAYEYSHRAVVFAGGLARSLSARLVLLGGVSHKVISHATVPVTVVR